MNTRTHSIWHRTSLVAAFAALAGTLLIPGIASAQTTKERARQNDKNLMRDLTVGLGVAAVYEASKGKDGNALVLGAGAVYAGKKYNDDQNALNRYDNRRFGYDDRDRPRYDDQGPVDYRPVVWNRDSRSDDRDDARYHEDARFHGDTRDHDEARYHEDARFHEDARNRDNHDARNSYSQSGHADRNFDNARDHGGNGHHFQGARPDAGHRDHD